MQQQGRVISPHEKPQVDVIIPTKHRSPVWKESIDSLKYLPFQHTLHLVTDGNNWAEAINIGIKESTGDILIMDDDVIINKSTFDKFDRRIADIIGFKLYFPDGRMQHAGSYMAPNGVRHREEDFDQPIEVPHVTASLMYINRNVIDDLKGMTEMPGYQFEDVDFSFRALQSGFKIVCLPNSATHYQGATKQQDPEFEKKASINSQIIHDKFYIDPQFKQLLHDRGFLQQI